jgi:hypothetical protein
MSRKNLVAEQLIGIIKDGLHNSHKVQVEACDVFLLKTREKLSQVPSLDYESFL